MNWECEMNKNKESRGIYNVTFNEKNATSIKTDLELIEDAIENMLKEAIILYTRGYHNQKLDKGFGAEHIKLHLEENSERQITIGELLNLGNSIREYLNIFKEPFIDNNGAMVFEWEDTSKVRFRAIVDKKHINSSISPRHTSISQAYTLTNQGTNATSIADVIISFYSDRNLNERMKFKNPQVERVFGGRDAHTPYTQAQSLDGRLVENNISSNTSDIIPQKDSKELQNQSVNQDINPKNKSKIRR